MARTVPKDAGAEWPPAEPPNLSARSVPMRDTEPVESRIARYRETAAALRRQAEQGRSDPEAIDQLLALADEWLKLAAVVEKKWLP